MITNLEVEVKEVANVERCTQAILQVKVEVDASGSTRRARHAQQLVEEAVACGGLAGARLALSQGATPGA
jgi:hypothetical protein